MKLKRQSFRLTLARTLLYPVILLGLPVVAMGCDRPEQQRISVAQETIQLAQEDSANQSFQKAAVEIRSEAPALLTDEDQQTVASDRQVGPVEVRTVKFQRQSEEGDCLIDIEYPQVEGLVDAQVQKIINSKLEALFLQAPGRALDVQACTTDDSYDRAPSPKAIFGWRSSYSVGLNQRGVLSVDGYASLTPGAYPFKVTKNITLNLKDGSTYNYKDLFKTDSSYVDTVNALIPEKIQQYLDAKIQAKQLEADQAQAIVNRFQPKEAYQFYLSDQGLVLVDVFEIHALRAIQVQIAPAELSGVVNPDGPVLATQPR